MQTPTAIHNWHTMLKEKNVAGLDTLIADDAVFLSPVVHTPQVGKEVTKAYLTAAFFVFGSDSFSYVREIYGENNAMLEFETEIDGIFVNGVDLIRWNDEHQIVEFKVMLRPLKAVNLIHQMMGKMLAQMKK